MIYSVARMQEVIVIGGGVVGLTSAWWLLEAGYRVTLLERAPPSAPAPATAMAAS